MVGRRLSVLLPTAPYVRTYVVDKADPIVESKQMCFRHLGSRPLLQPYTVSIFTSRRHRSRKTGEVRPHLAQHVEFRSRQRGLSSALSLSDADVPDPGGFSRRRFRMAGDLICAESRRPWHWMFVKGWLLGLGSMRPTDRGSIGLQLGGQKEWRS